MAQKHDSMPDRDFETLRGEVTIAARRMSKVQVLDLCDAIRAAHSRREESRDWDLARNGGVFGFV